MKKIIVIVAIAILFGLMAWPVSAVGDYYSAWPQKNCAASSCCCCCCSPTDVARVTSTITDADFYQDYKGKIVTLNQKTGESYFIDPEKKTAHYLEDYSAAYSFFFARGLSMSRANLAKMQLGLLPASGDDNDRDGLSDKLEIALGTNKLNFNSDKDVYSDKVELVNGYNPSGPGKISFDRAFTYRQAGKFYLEPAVYGAVWHVNPRDGKRYFIANQYDALSLIKQAGIPISASKFRAYID